jgi:hypothetical protein
MNCLGRLLFGPKWYGYQVPTHLTHFDEHSLKKLLSAAGFNDVKIIYQANCMNLLRSFELYLVSKDLKLSSYFITLLINNKRLGKFRAFISIVLKFFKLSGRLEFTAK